MDHLQLLLFFSASLGLGLSLFFSVVLLRWEQADSWSNQLLGGLLLFLSLRITKSVFYHFAELPLYIKNLGLAANLAVGPLLYFYGQSLADRAWKWRRTYLLHFIPAAIYVLASPILPNGAAEPAWHWLYPVVMTQAFIYAIMSLQLGYVSLAEQPSHRRWYLSFSWGLSALWSIYFVIFLGWIPIYLMGALSFSILMGIWGLLGWREKTVFQGWRVKRYQTSVLKEGQGAALLQTLKELLSTEPVFLDPGLTLATLAEKLGIHSKQLSQAINEETPHNFIQFINTYRIAYAQRLLLDPQRQDDKIIAIALDSGFRSLSTFNSVFKQFTNTTPSAFRTENSQKLANSLPDS